MGNTITIDRGLGIINIVPDGATDFDLVTEIPGFPDGVHLEYIGFLPSAVNDVLRFGEATADGVDIMTPLKSVTGGSMEKEFNGNRLYKPYMDDTDCTFGTPANVIIFIKYKGS